LAISKAFELTQNEWPSIARRRTGNVRPDLIEILLAGASRRKGVIEPAESADDLDLPQLGAVGPQRREDFLPRFKLKIDAARGRRADDGVSMPFDEARKQHLPRKVDDARSRADEGRDADVVADIHDPLLLDGDRARPSPVAVDGVDRAVAENEIGLPSRGTCRSCDCGRCCGNRRRDGSRHKRAGLEKPTAGRPILFRNGLARSDEIAKFCPIAADAHCPAPSPELERHRKPAAEQQRFSGRIDRSKLYQ
jgi:hypothetical protein